MSTSRRPAPRGVFLAGAALVALGTVGAWRATASLEAQEGTLTETSPEGARVHGFSALRLRARGAVHVTACAPGGASIDAWLEVHGRRERLTREAASVGRCAAASWSTPVALEVAPVVRFDRPPPRGTTLTLRHGGSLGAHNTLPFAALLLGVAAMVLAPLAGSLARPEAHAVEDLHDLARGVVRAAAGAALAHVAAVFAFSAGGGSARAMLAAVLTQSVGMLLAAAWSTGALEPGADVRATLELVPPPRRELARALVIGALLVAIALLISTRISNAGDTPAGRDLERVPLRYVVVFGGLLAPLAEEVFYRGALGRLCARFGRAATVLIPAAVFTAVHVAQLKGSPLALGPIAAVGVVNGVVRLATGGVVAPWLVHTAYNAALVSSALFAE
ncbi:MAG: CPBP family intramembrane glutamic endopeptidase [Polyangiales bacterium]